MKSEYRGHVIFSFAIGDAGGPYRSGYSVRRMGEIDAERPMLQASLDGGSPTEAEALTRATHSACAEIDSLLDQK